MGQADVLHSSPDRLDTALLAMARDIDCPRSYAPDSCMNTEELIAARSLAEIYQPLAYDSQSCGSERSNCIKDGQCEQARTEDCTDACHPCEEPHACTDDDCCDPISVCFDPKCNLGDDLDSICLPCHEHLDMALSEKDQVPDMAHDYQDMVGYDWSQPAQQGMQYVYSENQPSFGVSQQNLHNPDLTYSSTQSNDWSGIQNFHDGMDCFQLGHDPSYHVMAPSIFMEHTALNSPPTASRVEDTSQHEPSNSHNKINASKNTIFSPSVSDVTRCSSRNSYPSHVNEFTPTPSSPTSLYSARFSTQTASLPTTVPRCQWNVFQGGFHSVCGFVATSAKELHEHILDQHIAAMGGRGSIKHEKEPMICQWQGCKSAEEQKVWTALQHIKDHMLCHSQVRETCHNCGKELRDKKALKAHQAICGNQHMHCGFKCEICGKILKSPSTLKQHMNQHNGKVFKCDECGHTCADQSNLRKHKRIHQKDQHKMWKCQCCSKAFPNAYNRNRHEETMAKKGHRFVKSIDLSTVNTVM